MDYALYAIGSTPNSTQELHKVPPILLNKPLSAILWRVGCTQSLWHFNRGVSHYRILPISRDIGWPVQQLDYFRYKAS